MLRRLEPNHKKRPVIEENLAKAYAGYRGEKQVDHYLELLPDQGTVILQDLRLLNREKAFQLDTLVLTPSFILIIEVKNISGTLHLDSKQMVRTKENIEKGFLHPTAQAELQCRQLKAWLEQNKIKSIPIEYLVIISSPSTILKIKPGEHSLENKVHHAVNLLNEMEKLEIIYPKPALSPYLMQKVTKLLVEAHIPLQIPILDKYGISVKELKKGVQCPLCKLFPMRRTYGRWLCLSCKASSVQAHSQAIEDYLLLVQPTITNQQCREFLLLSSRQTATRLLEGMKLSHAGATKGRVYYQESPKNY